MDEQMQWGGVFSALCGLKGHKGRKLQSLRSLMVSVDRIRRLRVYALRAPGSAAFQGSLSIGCLTVLGR